jgi:hypothetical protein
MVRGRMDDNRLLDVVQINGKKARDCTPRLIELQTIAEKLRSTQPPETSHSSLSRR